MPFLLLYMLLLSYSSVFKIISYIYHLRLLLVLKRGSSTGAAGPQSRAEFLLSRTRLLSCLQSVILCRNHSLAPNKPHNRCHGMFIGKHNFLKDGGFLFWFDFPGTGEVQLFLAITLISAATAMAGPWRPPRATRSAGFIFFKLTVLFSVSFIVSLSGMQIQLSQLLWLTSDPFQTSPGKEHDPEASERSGCNSELSKSTVKTRYWLCGCMTKPQTHTSKKLRDVGGDISQQMAGTVRCLLVRAVVSGLQGLWTAA